MIEYKQIPKQVKLTVQQGRLPFTRRYGREMYGEEDNNYAEHSILYHANQTEKDHDKDMRTRRFKAEVRGSEPGAYSTKSNSVRSMLDADNTNLINPKSMNNPIEYTSQKQIIDDIMKPKMVEGSSQVPNSRFADKSNRSIAGNIELLKSSHKASHRSAKKSSLKSRHYVLGKIDPSVPYQLGPGEYLEEVTDEEEESEAEEEDNIKRK